MLQHNTMKLFEAHGTMTSQIIDTDMVDPFVVGETAGQTAAKLQERATHLGELFGAVINYARIVVDDIEHNSWANRDAKAALDCMADDASDLVGLIEKLAHRTAPDAAVENPVCKPVRIKELVAEHIDELAGKPFEFVNNWARHHGVLTRGLPAFWSEFTVALFHRMKGTNEKIPPISTGG